MGRMSAYMLVGLPFVVALALTLMNRGVHVAALQTSTGHALIGGRARDDGRRQVLLKKIVSFKG